MTENEIVTVANLAGAYSQVAQSPYAEDTEANREAAENILLRRIIEALGGEVPQHSSPNLKVVDMKGRRDSTGGPG